jgi:colanic acid/amylovoran biosynthesis protein
MKILIVNQPLNNRGDESAHKALLRSLCNNFSDVKIQILFVNANQNSIDQFKIDYNEVEYLNFSRKIQGGIRILTIGTVYNLPIIWYLHPLTNKILQLMKDVDLVVCAPGGICMGGFQDWYHISILSMAMYLKKKIAYYGRSFGPFPEISKQNKRFKAISYKLLHYFDFLSIRDAKSQMLAEEIGVNYVSTVDTAFLDSPEVKIPIEISNKISDHYIVFVPNELKWHYAFKSVSVDKIIQFYTQIIDIISKKYHNYKIVMLPQIFNDHNQNELSFFSRIKENSSHSKDIVILEDKYNSDIQQCIIRESKLLVGARYHSIVFALNNNVPFIALSYEHKISGLLNLLEKENLVIDIINIWSEEEKMNDSIKQLSVILNSLKKDSEAQLKAKDIAIKCMNNFILRYNR